MPATLVQNGVKAINDPVGLTPTFVFGTNSPSQPTPGNFIAIGICTQFDVRPVTVVDDQGNTYTQYREEHGSGSEVFLFACANVAFAGPVATITITFNAGPDRCVITMSEFSGMPATITTDGDASGTGGNAGGNQSVGNPNTTNADDLLIAVLESSANHPSTENPPAGWTQTDFAEATGGFGSQFNGTMAVFQPGAAVTSNVEFSSPDNTGQWVGVVVAFVISGAATINALITGAQVEFTSILAPNVSNVLITSAQIETFANNLPSAVRITSAQIEFFSSLPFPPPPALPVGPGTPITPGSGGGGGTGTGGSYPINTASGAYPSILPDPHILCCWLGQQQKCVHVATGKRFAMLRTKVPYVGKRH